MLRFSSTAFSFHLLPGPRPPEFATTSPFSSDVSDTHALWEGFGTLALLHNERVTDRGMILEVRPPEIITLNVLKEFTKTRGEWWHLPGELCTGDIGQANLLQAQVSRLYGTTVQRELTRLGIRRLRPESGLVLYRYQFGLLGLWMLRETSAPKQVGMLS